MSFEIGQKVYVRDYCCGSGGECTLILRPAEIAPKFTTNPKVEQVYFLDEKFRKGGRALHSVTVLASKIVTGVYPSVK